MRKRVSGVTFAVFQRQKKKFTAVNDAGLNKKKKRIKEANRKKTDTG